MIKRISSFDLRPVDFLTGRRVPLNKADKIKCACCGLPISKGAVMSNGDRIGDDCADTVRECSAWGIERYKERLARIGWKMRPSVIEYAQAAIAA